MHSECQAECALSEDEVRRRREGQPVVQEAAQAYERDVYKRQVWTTERWDIPDWETRRKSHMGKRTLMVYDRGTCLLVELSLIHI